MTSITKRMRDLREDHDKLQKEVAAALKMSQQQYQQYESGKVKPSVDLITSLAIYYNVSTDYILGITDNPNRA